MTLALRSFGDISLYVLPIRLNALLSQMLIIAKDDKSIIYYIKRDFNIRFPQNDHH